MSNYRVFKRRWWRDQACTVPQPGYRISIDIVDSEEEARAVCRAFNFNADGERIQRPFGLAYEYEELSA
jgi:hypothetical protein